jgi:Cu-Zn family superoxide dismutase
METLTDRVTLEGDGTSLFDADGSAILIHAAVDDFKTDPTGNSGARVACGVIAKKQ